MSLAVAAASVQPFSIENRGNVATTTAKRSPLRSHTPPPTGTVSQSINRSNSPFAPASSDPFSATPQWSQGAQARSRSHSPHVVNSASVPVPNLSRPPSTGRRSVDIPVAAAPQIAFRPLEAHGAKRRLDTLDRKLHDAVAALHEAVEELHDCAAIATQRGPDVLTVMRRPLSVASVFTAAEDANLRSVTADVERSFTALERNLAARCAAAAERGTRAAIDPAEETGNLVVGAAAQYYKFMGDLLGHLAAAFQGPAAPARGNQSAPGFAMEPSLWGHSQTAGYGFPLALPAPLSANPTPTLNNSLDLPSSAGTPQKGAAELPSWPQDSPNKAIVANTKIGLARREATNPKAASPSAATSSTAVRGSAASAAASPSPVGAKAAQGRQAAGNASKPAAASRPKDEVLG